MSGRVSTAQIFTNAQAHVAQTRERQEATAEKASTQKEIMRPSQDPAGWITSSALKDDQTIRETLHKNGGIASQVLKTTDTIFEQAQAYLHRAYELVISQAGTPLSGSVGRTATLSEVQGIYDGLLQVFNYKFGSRTLLAGFHSRGPAFDTQGNFVGDEGVVEVDIDRGTRLPLTISARRTVMGEGDIRGVNILKTFHRLMEGLQTDNSDLIHSTIEPMKRGIEQLSEARGELGSRMLSLDRAMNRHEVQKINNAEGISHIEDADAVKVFSELARDQTILDAAIRTSQKILSDRTGEVLFS